MSLSTMLYIWVGSSLITNVWLVIWAYHNWKQYVNRSVKTLEKYGE